MFCFVEHMKKNQQLQNRWEKEKQKTYLWSFFIFIEMLQLLFHTGFIDIVNVSFFNHHVFSPSTGWRRQSSCNIQSSNIPEAKLLTFVVKVLLVLLHLILFPSVLHLGKVSKCCSYTKKKSSSVKHKLICLLCLLAICFVLFKHST